MSILDELKDPQPEHPAERNSASRPRLPEAVSGTREIARIGDTISIRGDLAGAENLVLDCTIEGAVDIAGCDLTIGQTGRVKGDVTARLVRIEGEVAGNVTGSEKVVVTRTGRVQGNIVVPRVTLEDGARFKGLIDMDPGPMQPAAEPKSLRAVPAASPPDGERAADTPTDPDGRRPG